MEKKFLRSILVLGIFVTLFTKVSCAVEVTIGFLEPIKGYQLPINHKTSWHYSLLISHPNTEITHYIPISEQIASAQHRARLPECNLLPSNNTFKIQLSYGQTISNVFYDHNLSFTVPEDALEKDIKKIRIFLKLDMSGHRHKSEIAKVEYVYADDACPSKINPLSITMDP